MYCPIFQSEYSYEFDEGNRIFHDLGTENLTDQSALVCVHQELKVDHV